jgi:hypothetical protein
MFSTDGNMELISICSEGVAKAFRYSIEVWPYLRIKGLFIDQAAV